MGTKGKQVNRFHVAESGFYSSEEEECLFKAPHLGDRAFCGIIRSNARNRLTLSRMAANALPLL